MIYLIIFLSLVLRLISLNQSLWLDEATTALVARMSFPDIFNKFLPGDFHPPFHYLLTKLWVSVFGSGEVSLRIPSVIFGLGIVYFVYLISKKLFDKKTATVASILASTSGLLIYYSQEARMYILAAFLVTLLVYFFIERKWIGFSTTLAFLAMTDYVALLILPVFWLIGRKEWKKMFLTHIPLAIVFGFWLPIFYKQIGGGLGNEGNAWWNILGILSWKNLGLIPVKFILGRISFDNKIIYGLVSGAAVSLFALPVAIYILNILRQPLRVGDPIGSVTLKGNPCKVIFAWLVVPILAGILISSKMPILYYFRFLFCLPAFYIMVAAGIFKLPKKSASLFFVLTVLINIVTSGIYLFDKKFQRENWREMAKVVGEDMIIYPSNSQKEALIYYQKGDQVIYYKDFEGGEKNIWLSRYVWNIFDPVDDARIKIDNLGYNKVQEINLNGVEFWKYSLLKQYASRN